MGNDAELLEAQTYRNTTRAWSDDEVQALLLEAGFSHGVRCPLWPCNSDSLRLWSARRGTA
ncbi:MAG: hypothetical protein GX575_06145 [Candidatus Anammoximicrobium sp.]|nr:hypothetical protein [Candidatus Anammoximicrobium sp.]